MIENTTRAVPKNRMAYILEADKGKSSRPIAKRRQLGFSTLNFRHIRTPEQIRKAASESGGHGLWIAARGQMVAEFIKAVMPASRRFGSLLVLDHLNEATRLAAVDLFRIVAATDQPESFLPPPELEEVLIARNRAELFIGGTVDRDSEVIVLIRGDLSTLIVPMASFRPSGDGTKPDFSHFSVIDYGHTLRFGNYEASADGVLYEFDPKYRKRLDSQRKSDAKGFGPSLRRLRKQKGLKRSDFAPLNDKTLARIERGEINTPHGETLEIIAKKLNVRSTEIESY